MLLTNTPRPEKVQPRRPPAAKVFPGNNVTLYVPVGSAESYKADPLWNTFKAIVEEETPYVPMYQISASAYIPNGSVTVNGDPLGAVVSVEAGSSATIKATPDKGYHLAAFAVNGEDVMKDADDGTYVIQTVDRNYMIECTFEKDPCLLSIYTAEGGCAVVDAKEGMPFRCSFREEEGWKLNTVLYNGIDVTSELDESQCYTIPSVNHDGEIRASFVKDASGTGATLAPAGLKVFVGSDGVLVIRGLAAGSTANVVSAGGLVVDNAVSVGDDIRIPLATRGIYLVETPGYTFKVQY